MPDKAATATTYAASAATFTAGALSLNEIAILASIFIAVVTYFTNLYFKRKWIADERAYKAAILLEIKNKSSFNIVSDMLKTEDKSGE